MKSEAISRSSIALVAITLLVGSSFGFLIGTNQLQQGAQAPKPAETPALQKLKAYGAQPTNPQSFLVVDAGTERGIWANNGLAPEWVSRSGPMTPDTVKEHVASGIKIGMSAIGNLLIARSDGVPIKIFGCVSGENRANRIYVRADSPIKSMKDLDGKKIAVEAINAGGGRNVAYISNKVGIKPEIVPLGNETSSLVALKLGRVDAYLGTTISLRLVDSGELRIIATTNDFTPKPWAGLCVFATEDLIEQNPDLVKRFVKATLETARYVKDNPSYAADLYMKRTNAPRDQAERDITVIDWTPGGRGSGTDLIAAVTNLWQYLKETGVLPADANLKIEDAVDVRFLP